MTQELFFNHFCKQNVWAKVVYKEDSKLKTMDCRVYKPSITVKHVLLKTMKGERVSMPTKRIKDITRIFYIANFIK